MRYINLRLTYLLTYQSGYFTISNYAFEVNFLALVVSEILIGHKFTLGGPVLPVRLLVEKNFVVEASALLYLMVFLISTF